MRPIAGILLSLALMTNAMSAHALTAEEAINNANNAQNAVDAEDVSNKPAGPGADDGNWCPPTGGLSLLGVQYQGYVGKPGDYMYVAAKHPSAKKNGELSNRMQPLYDRESKARFIVETGPGSIETTEYFLAGARDGLANAQRNVVSANAIEVDGKTFTAEYKAEQIARAAKSLAESQERVAGLEKTLARETKDLGDAQAEYARVSSELAPLKVESKLLYDEVVNASKQCP